MFILMSGDYGCLPDNSECYETRESALEGASEWLAQAEPVVSGNWDEIDAMIDETMASLRESGFADLFDDVFGADYISIEEGECESDAE